MKNRNILFISIITAAALIAGCTAAENPAPPASTPSQEIDNVPTSDAAETEGVEQDTDEEPLLADEIAIATGRDLYYGNTQWHIIHGSLQVWEPLIYPDENLNPQPWLAESWEPNDDLTEWTFHLRPGILFHDGTPLNAEAAVMNLTGIHENYTPLPTLDSMEVIDELSFRILLTDPTPALPDLLSFFGSAMLSPASFEQSESDTPIPYGTGPYTFAGLLDDDSIVLERNEAYWGTPARTRRIIYRNIPDATTRIQALQSGEIDAIADVGCIQPNQAELILADDSLELLTQDVLTTHYLFFNTDRPPFDNPELREAVTMALDRDQIVRETVYGYGIPASSLLTQLAASWLNPDAVPYTDMAMAEELAAGVLGEKRVTVSLLVHSSLANRWPYAEIAQIIQFELADLGIDVEIEVVEGGTWNERLGGDDYHMSMRPYTMSSGDPDDFMTYWVRPDGIFNQKYSISYNNEEVLALIEEAVSATDPLQRKALYDQIQAVLLEEAPFTSIYHEVTLYATRSTVSGLTLDALFRPTLDTAVKLVE